MSQQSKETEAWLWLPIGMGWAWLIQKASWFWENSPDLQFGWVIPLLSGYLLFEAFEKKRVIVGRWSVWAIGLVFVGLVFLFMTQVYQNAYGLTATSMAGLGLGFLSVSFGCLLHAYGVAGWRRFGFPLVFFMIALPVPSVIYGEIISTLQRGIATVNVEVLALLGTPASLQGNLVQLPTGVVGIDEACSGIRSLQSTVMATLFIGYLTLQRFSLRLILFVAGILLAILGNLVRVFSLSYSASQHGIEVVNAAHDVAGWSILGFTVVGVGCVAWFLGRVEQALGRTLAAMDSMNEPAPEG